MSPCHLDNKPVHFSGTHMTAPVAERVRKAFIRFDYVVYSYIFLIKLPYSSSELCVIPNSWSAKLIVAIQSGQHYDRALLTSTQPSKGLWIISGARAVGGSRRLTSVRVRYFAAFAILTFLIILIASPSLLIDLVLSLRSVWMNLKSCIHRWI